MLQYKFDKVNRAVICIPTGDRKTLPSDCTIGRVKELAKEHCYRHLKKHLIDTAEKLTLQRMNVAEHIGNLRLYDWSTNTQWKIIECNNTLDSKDNALFAKYFSYVLEILKHHLYPPKGSKYFTGFNALYNDLESTLKYYFTDRNEVLKTDEITVPQQLSLFN